MRQEVEDAQLLIKKRNEEAKAAFIRHVFHEIRTPLHVLSSFFSYPDPSRDDFEDMKHHTGSSPSLLT